MSSLTALCHPVLRLYITPLTHPLLSPLSRSTRLTYRSTTNQHTTSHPRPYPPLSVSPPDSAGFCPSAQLHPAPHTQPLTSTINATTSSTPQRPHLAAQLPPVPARAERSGVHHISRTGSSMPLASKMITTSTSLIGALPIAWLSHWGTWRMCGMRRLEASPRSERERESSLGHS
jgi:hypothetical protein